MLTEDEKRLHRVCFTGHRPEKLNQPEGIVVKSLTNAIHQAIADGKNVFISGVARGVDIWAAEIVLRLRNEGENVPARMRVLSEDGVLIGNRGIMPCSGTRIWFDIFAQDTAELASKFAMSGW